MRIDEWKKSARMQNPNSGRPLPNTPKQNDTEEQRMAAIRRHRLLKQQQVQSEEESYTSRENQAPPPQRKPTRPVKADFVISVPIFNETLDHSYRKKNEYVYVDHGNEDTASLLHQSLSRSSSTRELRSQRPPSGRSHEGSRGRVKSGNRSKRSRSYDGRVYGVSERGYTSERSLRKERRSDGYYEDRQSYTSERQLRASDRQRYAPDRQRYVSDRQHYVDRQQYSDRQQYAGRQPISDRHLSSRGNYMYEETPYRQQGVPRPLGEKKRRPLSGSEASFNTMNSTMNSTGTGHSYIYEEMPAAYKMRKATSSSGLYIDSDDDDRR